MGLLNIIRAFKDSAKAGGNFGFIAQNVATIYYVLKESEFGKQLNEDQLLFATALCDTIPYISNEAISIDELRRAVIYSKIGCVGIFPYKVKHDSPFEHYENKEIINLTMQIEVLIFSAEMLTDYHNVVNVVVDKKEQISKMVNRTLEQGHKCSIYPTILKGMNHLLNNDEIKKTILSFEL